MNNPSVLVVGSANIDQVIRLARLPTPGETIGGGTYHQHLGGKGANQAVAATRAGSKVTMIGSVGDDREGKHILETLTHEGISIEGIVQTPDASTGIAMIWVDERGENMIAVAPGANDVVQPQHIQIYQDVFQHIDIVLLQLEIPFEAVYESIRLAKSHSVHVMLNPAPARLLPDDLLRMVDTLIVNHSELEMLSQRSLSTKDDVQNAMRGLKSLGISNVITTLGDQGSYLLNDELNIHIPAFQVQAIDTTGAGDIFCGNLAVQIALSTPWEEALRFSSAASAISVMREGALNSAPLREETQAFLK